MAGSCAHVPEAACTNLVGAKVSQKDAILHILGICALITDWCFHSQSCRQSREAMIFVPPPTVANPSHSHWSDYQGLKGPALFPPHLLFFFFSLFGSHTLKTRTCKSNLYMGKIRKWPCMSRERNTRDLGRTQADPWHRDSQQQQINK